MFYNILNKNSTLNAGFRSDPYLLKQLYNRKTGKNTSKRYLGCGGVEALSGAVLQPWMQKLVTLLSMLAQLTSLIYRGEEMFLKVLSSEMDPAESRLIR